MKIAYIRGFEDFTPQRGKQGKPYFEIIVSSCRGKQAHTTRFYYNENLSRKNIKREVLRFANEFEEHCRNGEVFTKKERQERIAAEEEAARKAAEEEAKKYTVQRFIDEVYIKDGISHWSINTIESIRAITQKYIHPSIGNYAIDKVIAHDISNFFRELQARELSLSIREKCYTILHAAFHKAYMEELIKDDPMNRVERPKATNGECFAPTDAYTASEAAYILQCAQQEPLIWKTFILFLVDSGARRGEALGLLWHNVDFQNNYVTIDGSLNYTSKNGVVRGPTKNREIRKFAVSEEIMGLFRIIKAQQNATTPSEYVFSQTNSSQPVHPQSPNRYFKKFAEKYGIKDFHPHKLRHTYVSIAMTNGADPVSVSAKIGHKDIDVTFKKYAHSNQAKIDGTSSIFRKAILDASASADGVYNLTSEGGEKNVT